MLVKELETYDQWDITLPSIPERSYLYHLEPAGLGTPNVESLLSYAMRLVAAHEITVEELVDKLISLTRKLFKAKGYVRNIRYNSLVLQGSCLFYHDIPGNTGLEQIKALERLTLRQNLWLLTALPLNKLIPLAEPFRRKQAWCPTCLQEWQETGRVVYEPLLWSLKFVCVCAEHQRRLYSVCFFCGIPFMSFPRTHSKPGYCHRCGEWLGVQVELFNRFELDEQELEWQLWINVTLGELLVHAPSLSSRLDKPKRTRLHQRLREYVAQSRPKSWNETERKRQIDFAQLLRFCYGSKISLLELITSEVCQLEATF